MGPDEISRKERKSEKRRAKREDRVESLAAQLNAICRRSKFDLTMNVGRQVVRHLCAGDLDAWTRRGRKSASFRQLAKHPKLGMTRSALHRHLAIYEVCARLGVFAWKHISIDHVAMVLGVAKHDQERLLVRGEAERWSPQQLGDEAFATETPREGRHKVT